MAEGEFWQETLRRRRKQRVETLVSGILGGFLGSAGDDDVIAGPDVPAIKLAFRWADAVIAESDRREKDGE